MSMKYLKIVVSSGRGQAVTKCLSILSADYARSLPMSMYPYEMHGVLPLAMSLCFHISVTLFL